MCTGQYGPARKFGRKQGVTTIRSDTGTPNWSVGIRAQSLPPPFTFSTLVVSVAWLYTSMTGPSYSAMFTALLKSYVMAVNVTQKASSAGW